MQHNSPQSTLTTESLFRDAIALGIDAIGVCAAEPYTSCEADIAGRMEQGLFADLKFTMTRTESSCHPERALEGTAVSVISAALCYWAPDAAHPDESYGVLARYTRWDAYSALHGRLEQLAGEIRETGHDAQVLVDSNHHVDREAAARSGVGFYGKHTNVITRRHGSWVVLGTIITSAALEATPEMRPGCGSCTRCIDACPTDAITEAGILDVNNCITYWAQSRHEVPLEINGKMQNMLYGCDICQDVCPWNRGVEGRRAGLDPIDGSVMLVDWLNAPAADLDERYERLFVPRRDMRFLRRNALIAMGNNGNTDDIPILAHWLSDDDELLRTTAHQALVKIGGEEVDALLRAST